MAETTRSKYRFRGEAGAVSLSLCNTVDDRPALATGDFTPRGDHLECSSDVVEWLTLSHVLTGRVSSADAVVLLRELKQIRELLYEIFIGVIRNELPVKKLDSFNSLFAKLPVAHLHHEKSSFYLSRPFKNIVERVRGVILDDAVGILLKSSLERLRVCAAEECGWLFIDNSKNGTRRWCEMGDCGNREKAKRFYERTKRAEQ